MFTWPLRDTQAAANDPLPCSSPGALGASRQAGSELDDKPQRDRKAVRASLAFGLSPSNKEGEERASLSPALMAQEHPDLPTLPLRLQVFVSESAPLIHTEGCFFLYFYRNQVSAQNLDLWPLTPSSEKGKRTSSSGIDTLSHEDCQKPKGLVKSDIDDVLLLMSDILRHREDHQLPDPNLAAINNNAKFMPNPRASLAPTVFLFHGVWSSKNLHFVIPIGSRLLSSSADAELWHAAVITANYVICFHIDLSCQGFGA